MTRSRLDFSRVKLKLLLEPISDYDANHAKGPLRIVIRVPAREKNPKARTDNNYAEENLCDLLYVSKNTIQSEVPSLPCESSKCLSGLPYMNTEQRLIVRRLCSVCIGERRRIPNERLGPCWGAPGLNVPTQPLPHTRTSRIS